MDILNSKINELAAAIKNKKISSVEVTKFFLNRIDRHNKTLNAFVTINDKAINEAEKIDQQIAQGKNVGALAGIPIGVKDLVCTKNIKTTAASKMLQNFIPPYDATLVERLKSAGAIVLGKLNLDEFAMGSSNENSIFGPCKNPWNTEYVPGGSSGGSASAQAARLCMGSIGTDTGGSIRQPSSFCGVVGIKPTYGRVSRYGVVAFASSLDQAGPMANSVEDAALMLQVISGHDVKDSTSADQSVPDFQGLINSNIKGMKIGILKQYEDRSAWNQDVSQQFDKALLLLKSLGAEIVEVSVPYTKYAVSMYYLIAASEASSNLSRYDGVKYGYRHDFKDLSSLSLDEFYSKTRAEGFGTEVKRRIMLGTFCLSSGYYEAYYNKACQVRRHLRDQFIEAFKQCDVICSPVTTTPAFKIKERVYDPLKMYLNDIFTTSTNLAGLPGMSVPFGFSSEGLPIGLQITGSHFNEQQMFNLALAIEKSQGLSERKPNVY